MDDEVKPVFSIYVEFVNKTDKKMVSDFFADEFHLTDNQQFFKNGKNCTADILIMDAVSATSKVNKIKKLKERYAPSFIPLLVLAGKKENQLTAQLWNISDDVLQIPVSKEILKARVHALLATRSYSRSLEIKKRKLEESNSTLSMYYNAIEAVTSGIVITDPLKEDNPVIFFNRAFQELTGYEKDEILGRNCRFLQNDDHNQEPVKKLREHIDRGEPVKVVLRNYRKDGSMFWNELKISPVKDKQGEIEFFVGIQNNVTELVETQKKLTMARNQWQSIVSQSPDMIQVSVNGIIRFLNQKGAEIYGAQSPKEIVGKKVVDMFEPESRQLLEIRMNTLENGGEVPPHIYSLRSLDGKAKYIKVQSLPVTYKGEQALQTVGQDITEIIQSNKELVKTVTQKQNLLQEVHHRVKNNLAMINGLIELQLIENEDNEIANALKGTQSRILSIAKVHELLYQQDNLKEIDFREYLQELTSTISNLFSNEGQVIAFDLELAHVKISLSQAVSSGLLFNELISNSIKHASRNKQNIKIAIDIKVYGDQVYINYKDNGAGLKSPKMLEEEGNFGMMIIRTLMKQLEANWEYIPGDGFNLGFQFNKRAYQGFI
ncbi:MAG: PAS domain S-box protein [Balneolaceae bacterium]|nr:PAS domain S-box protein [Balneolaceae bacterium]